MVAVVLLTDGSDDLADIMRRIVELREARLKSPAKRRFDSGRMKRLSEENGYVPGTYYDYQDVSFRYLKATGLFQARGRGIALVPEHKAVARLLAGQGLKALDNTGYLKHIANGDALPTDDQRGANEALKNLLENAGERGISFDLSPFDLSNVEDLSLARYEIEDLILKSKESDFAARQAEEIKEILAYLRLLEENRASVRVEEETISIPSSERPAYFEWVLWRAVLALNHLVTPPDEVRRFKIDQDFLPVGTAAGGGADVIAEYEDAVLVIEVTLTENSRQEAAEGEPVRRHVADVLERFESEGKDVYGLFIARRIDTNTAETFRIGVWYKKGDERVTLNVVPLTIAQLRTVLERAAKANHLHPSVLIDTILECATVREASDGAPIWKTRIAELIGA